MITRILILTLCTVACVSACTASPTPREEASTEFTGLYRLHDSGFDEAWVKPGAALSSYAAIAASPIQSADAEVIQPGSSVHSKINLDWEMTEMRQASLAAAWDHAIKRAAENAGLDTELTQQRTIRIDAALLRIAPRANFRRAQNAAGNVVLFSEDSGEAWMEFRLHDNASGELLAVIRDRQQLGPGLWRAANTVTAEADTRNTLNNWATRLMASINGN